MPAMRLHEFLPYRLAVVAEAVSHALAAVYGKRYALSRDEWRVLAQLAEVDEIKTTELGALTTLDKMQVSRALKRLKADGMVERRIDDSDRRNLRVRLAPPGRSLYRRVVPMAQAREAFLLEALTEQERLTLVDLLDKLLAQARKLRDAG